MLVQGIYAGESKYPFLFIARLMATWLQYVHVKVPSSPPANPPPVICCPLTFFISV